MLSIAFFAYLIISIFADIWFLGIAIISLILALICYFNKEN